jgi:hypothetical protein
MLHDAPRNRFLRLLLIIGVMAAPVACSDESPARGSGGADDTGAASGEDAANGPGEDAGTGGGGGGSDGGAADTDGGSAIEDGGNPGVDGDSSAEDGATGPDSDSIPADGGPSADGDTPDNGLDTPPVQPRVGVWTYDQQGLQNNTCGDYAVTEDDTPFRVIESGDGTFVVEQSDPGNFTCTLTGTTFACPSRIFDTFPIPDTDAVLTLNVRIDGVVESERRLSGLQTVDVTCAGVSCAAAPIVIGVTFPCAWEVPFEAEFQF